MGGSGVGAPVETESTYGASFGHEPVTSVHHSDSQCQGPSSVLVCPMRPDLNTRLVWQRVRRRTGEGRMCLGRQGLSGSLLALVVDQSNLIISGGTTGASLWTVKGMFLSSEDFVGLMRIARSAPKTESLCQSPQ